jgi:hypothetical protein
MISPLCRGLIFSPHSKIRHIFYSEHTKQFSDLFVDIPNIYTEIHPNYVYLLLVNKNTLQIHDNKGRPTELMVLPF